ncbi:hypothetical protein L4D06_09715 [Enterovibrio makurazakiensis]|uniref:hypothetical protein n=1 Tax=Enterovibrio makurazakiensis TaxID=2910232 RepID=UPI003D193184
MKKTRTSMIHSFADPEHGMAWHGGIFKPRDKITIARMQKGRCIFRKNSGLF